MKGTKTAADYAAIAVAPLLIFLMISSLANFLVLTLYRGSYEARLCYILLMYTMGTVGIARVAIERDRSYSFGYAGVLGLVTFVAMLRFVDSPIFVLVILALIAYLSDIIVRDCTLIDETVDASGQGLVDAGRIFVGKQIRQAATEGRIEFSEAKPAAAKPHQPGRTVLYLALAALPLFGLGQFFLRNQIDSWERAQRLLAFYLFASLSLLVTTSFLGLRRYLRQRQVDMPTDVSVAWLSGGLAMIAAVLLIAYMAPMPGQALATFRLPIQLDSPDNQRASRFGWGSEGAEDDAPGNPRVADPEAKDSTSAVAQTGAPAGNVGEGNRKQGPTGSQSGGQAGGQSGGQPPSQSSPSKGSPSKGSPSKGSPSKGSPSKGSPSKGSPSKGSPDQSSLPRDSQSQSDSKSSDTEATSRQSPEGSSDQTQSAGQSEEGETASDSPAEQREPGDSAGSSERSRERNSSSSMSQAINQSVSVFSGLIKFIVFVGLIAVVLVFLWLNRDWISQWWDSLFGRRSDSSAASTDEFLAANSQVPPRSFSSFRNPIGRESDVRRVVVITYQAFEAWAREQGVPRGRDETPSEFLRRAVKVAPQASTPAGQIVDAYNRIAYGMGRPTEGDMKAAAEVWQLMQSS